jgi:hypothetical protein
MTIGVSWQLVFYLLPLPPLFGAALRRREKNSYTCLLISVESLDLPVAGRFILATGKRTARDSIEGSEAYDLTFNKLDFLEEIPHDQTALVAHWPVGGTVENQS